MSKTPRDPAPAPCLGICPGRPFDNSFPHAPRVAACLRVICGAGEWIFNVKGFVLLMVVPFDLVNDTIRSSWTYPVSTAYPPMPYHDDLCCNGGDFSFLNWRKQELSCTNDTAVREDWRGPALYWTLSLIAPIVIQLLMLLWATREAVMYGPGSLRVILKYRQAVNGRWFRRLVYFNMAITVAAGVYFSTLPGERSKDVNQAWYLIVLAVIGLRDLLHPWEPSFLDVDAQQLIPSDGRGDGGFDIHLRASLSLAYSVDYSDQMSTLHDALLTFQLKGDDSFLRKVVLGYDEGAGEMLHRVVVHATASPEAAAGG